MPAAVLGEQKSQSVTADDLAQWSGTINYEIICSLGNRLPRIYKS
jgi:alanine racemase